MEYRTFGRSGWQVSEIGMGTWQMGGTWGPVDDRESIAALHHAFEHGVNLADTAILYGPHRSERVVGEAVKQWTNNKIYVATKIQPVSEIDSADESPSMRGHYPAFHVRREVEASLQRLQVERIDLLQLHLWLPDGHRELEWLEILNDLRLEGKVDKIGVSLRDIRPSEGVAIARLGLVDSIQVLYNLFEQEPADELFRAAEQNGTAIIARVPFDSGALTGTWTKDTYNQWPEGDKRHTMYRGDRFAETLQRAEAIQSDLEPYGISLPEAAMRFCLADPAVGIVIPGMRTKQEVDLNLPYSDGKPLPADLLDMLKKHRWKHSFYS